MYLITKWFGTFLIKDNKIIKKKLFTKDYTIIANNLQKIENNNILLEEIRIVKNYKKEKIIVNEKRLKKIGTFNIL